MKSKATLKIVIDLAMTAAAYSLCTLGLRTDGDASGTALEYGDGQDPEGGARKGKFPREEDRFPHHGSADSGMGILSVYSQEFPDLYVSAGALCLFGL